ncbi:MAG: aminotransferase class V-fold PLP-dependent enzyme [Nitrospirota bacterium]|nr:aminotransferase class V-fold PLP-dependent enzyme [Nitrospirota bacterium]
MKNDFHLKDGLIYLNHAGVSPWPLRTARAVEDFAGENAAQGSYNYPQWIRTETALRIKAKELLNAGSKDDIAFLKNTSEALSVVAYGLPWKKGDNIVSSSQEFPSNRIVWESLAGKGVEFREADLYSAETPEDALFCLVNGSTRLITISSVQYSTGLRMDLKRIGEFCKEKNILFCVDAIQSLGAMQFDALDIHADFVMADGHKWMLGPEGLAIFYSTPEARERLSLNQYGWHMVERMGDFDRREWETAKTARCFECGSPNILGIHALNASLSLLLDTGMENIEKEVLNRSEYLFNKIRSMPELEFITSTETGRYAGIVTFRHKRADNAGLYQYLAANNVVCAMRAGGIRLSPHYYTPYEHLDRVMEMVAGYN